MALEFHRQGHRAKQFLFALALELVGACDDRESTLHATQLHDQTGLPFGDQRFAVDARATVAERIAIQHDVVGDRKGA